MHGLLKKLLLVPVAMVVVGMATGVAPAAAAEKLALGVCQSTAPGPAKFAQAMWRGAELVVNEANDKGGIAGRKLELVGMNIGKNDPSLARQSMQKAIGVDKIVSLLCWGSNVMLANNPLLDEHKVLGYTMSLSARVPQESKYVQQLELITTVVVRPIAEYVKRQLPQVKKVGVLYIDYEFGYEMVKACEAEFGKRGIAVVAKASHPIAPPDLRAQFTKLMEANPDAIYIANIGGGEMVMSIRTARELGFKGLLLTHTGADAPEIFSLSVAEKDLLFVAHVVRDDAPAALKDLVTTQHGYASSGYDFAWINRMLMTEVAKEGKVITGETLLAKLRTLRAVRTPATDYEFLPDGTTLRSVAVVDIRQGKRHHLQTFSPADLK